MTVKVSFTSAARPGGKEWLDYESKFHVESFDDVPEELERRWGITIPRRPRGVFIDQPDGTARQIGVLASGWADGERKKYWRTAWITFYEDRQPSALPAHYIATN